MIVSIATSGIEEAAKQAAGNWKQFDSFVWWREEQLEDADQWAIAYTKTRDSKLTEVSNSACIAKALKPFMRGKYPSVVAESHSHWLVGHIDGFGIKVYSRGRITKAFCVFYELLQQIEAFSILDESDYAKREHAATLANIDFAACLLKDRFNLPEDWREQVHAWLLANDESQVENTEDEGGWPDEEGIEAAFTALGFEEIEAAE